jgi:acylphosphatase
MNAMIVARHLTIHGRVQGVWYRAWTVQTARELGLAGWVRNRRDGSVEAVVQGEAEAVLKFVELARTGPPHAAVERIETRDTDPEPLATFEKRPTCWSGGNAAN